ncbi:MAG TPA: 4-(cytidine 5'-diphospho)-2-C-methyl-D-erythritol kinase [Vicinamibacterales bacterium]|nr:4-(cytidine 5'-diphospho)-2-C-methyl-D-erythritol kinase [Vicinamibacterales bacterium]
MELILPAFAKINLDLRILGVRPDGFHDLKTIFQSLALHDVLTFRARKGPFAIECDDPKIPTDERNLIWRAAALLWRTAGRRGDKPRDAVVNLRKRIPAEAGLGGGSADATMAILGLVRTWRLDVDVPTMSRLAARVGADVPFFLVGGTALGLGRGDDIYPLADLPRTHVVLVRPRFGVSTGEAYGWYDNEPRRRLREPARKPLPPNWPAWAINLRNDLELPVTVRHPTIGRIKQALLDAGAVVAAMSGSGSAVFGLYERQDAARRTAADLARAGWLVVSTRTLSRAEYAARIRPMLAGIRKRRIS